MGKSPHIPSENLGYSQIIAVTVQWSMAPDYGCSWFELLMHLENRTQKDLDITMIKY